MTPSPPAELAGDPANATARPYERDATVHELFAAQAARTPDATAIVAGDRTVTYRELDQRSSALAAALPVAPGDPVGLLLPRSVELVTGALAILGAGGAYVPIDPDYPAERIDLVLADCGARVLLAARMPAGVRFGGRLVTPDQRGPARPAPAVGAQDPAYLIYTSGTTGRPKGVQVPHRAVVRLVRNTDYVPLSADTRILPTGAMVFDAATFELWGALLNGGSLHLVDPAAVLDAAALGRALAEHRITTMWLTAPLFNQVVEQDPAVFRPLRQLLVGGDALSARHVGAVLAACPQVSLVNGYGPTENTTFSTTHLVRPADLDRIPIGRPIANSTAYVLDPDGRPCPIGVVGELYVGGDGVATGYRGRPGLTAAAFGPDPFRPGGTLYRTGDLASRRPDGVLDFHGRRDAQVKVRGFRIEPAEIETALLDCPGVRAAVVLAMDRPDGADKFLCGWYVGPVAAGELRTRLERRLPEHLVPAFLVPVPAIPLNRSGKVDRAALPRPDTGTAPARPRTEAERTLLGLVERVLGLAGVGVRDRLADLGADSLALTLLAARVEQALGARLPLAELREATVEGIAAAVPGRPAAPLPPAPDRPYHPLSPQQHQLYVEQAKDVTATHYNVPVTVRLPAGTDAGRLVAAVRLLADRHEALRTELDLVDGRPVQRVRAAVDLRVEVRPGAGGPLDGLVRPFDLAVAPLCRIRVCPEPAGVRLQLDLHHCVVDGVSLGVLVGDLLELYADPTGRTLPPVGPRYRDYAEWTASPAAARERAVHGTYWQRLFARPHARADLPLDFPRPPVRSTEGGALEFGFGPERTGRLRALAAELGSTSFAVLAAAYAAMLARLTGDPDVVVGTPVSGRTRAGLDRMVGMLANTVALRVAVRPEIGFRDLVREVARAADAAIEHQDHPFQDLVAALAGSRDYSRTPLFDALVALHSRRYLQVGGVPVRPEWNGRAVFDLNLQVYEEPGDLRASWQYAAALFRPATARGFRDLLVDLLDTGLADPAAPLGPAPVPAGAVPALDFDL